MIFVMALYNDNIFTENVIVVQTIIISKFDHNTPMYTFIRYDINVHFFIKLCQYFDWCIIQYLTLKKLITKVI